MHLGDVELELSPERNLPPAAVVARLVRVGLRVEVRVGTMVRVRVRVRVGLGLGLARLDGA